jgi:hypothetical protein
MICGTSLSAHPRVTVLEQLLEEAFRFISSLKRCREEVDQRSVESSRRRIGGAAVPRLSYMGKAVALEVALGWLAKKLMPRAKGRAAPSFC